jgi:hypothetical protein
MKLMDLLPWIKSFIHEFQSGPIFDIMIIKDSIFIKSF